MDKEISNLEEYDLKVEFLKMLKPTKTTIFFVLPLFLLTLYGAIFLTENIYQTISLIGIGIFISLASIQDFNEKMVFEILLYPTAFFSLLFLKTEDIDRTFTFVSGVIENIIVGSFLVFSIWFLSYILSIILKKETLGTGDFPIFFLFIILLKIHTPIGLIVMALSAIIYKIIKKEEEIPLIPFLYFGLITTFIYFQTIGQN